MPRLMVDLKDEELRALRSWLMDDISPPTIQPDAAKWAAVKALRKAALADRIAAGDWNFAHQQPHGDRRDHRADSPPFVLQFKIADAEILKRMGCQPNDNLRHAVTEFRVTVTATMPRVDVKRATTNLLGEPVWDDPGAGYVILSESNVLGMLMPALLAGAADTAKVSHTPNHTPVYDLGTLVLPPVKP